MEYFPSEELLIPLAMAGIVVVFLFYQFYNRYTGIKALEQLLQQYYQEQDIELLSISKLKAADKLKYGVPINPFISFYATPFKIFSALDESFHRMLETKNASGKEHIRYVEITFTGKKGMHVNEFDTYEF